MVAYVLLLVSFLAQMTSWLPLQHRRPTTSASLDAVLGDLTGFRPRRLQHAAAQAGVDGLTMATPLDTFEDRLTQGLTATEVMTHKVFEGWGGIGWSWVNLGYLLGGLFLLQQKVINWRIPTAVLGALLLAATLGYLATPGCHRHPMLHLFSGATMLGAFFIATDPVSASTTAKAPRLRCVLIGVLVHVIRRFGGYPMLRLRRVAGQPVRSLIDSLTRPGSMEPSQMNPHLNCHRRETGSPMLKSMRKNGLTLALFALGCTAMVVLTNELTRIDAHQQELEKQPCRPCCPRGVMTTIWWPVASWSAAGNTWAAMSPCPLYRHPWGCIPATRWKPWPPMVTVEPFAWWSAPMPRGRQWSGCWPKEGNPGLVTR